MRTVRYAVIAIVGALTSLHAHSAPSKPPNARFFIEIHVQSDGSASNKRIGEISTLTSRQNLRVSVELPAGGLSATNENDVEARAKRNSEAVEQASKAPSREELRRQAAKVAEEYRKCGQDVACMSRLSQQYSPPVTAHPKPHETERRYAEYIPPGNCNVDYHAVIDTQRKGTIADVQGAVPFTEVSKADFRPTKEELPLACSRLGSIVLDVKENLIYVEMHSPLVKGSFKRKEGGRDRLEEPHGEIRLHPGAMKWVNEVLQKAPRAGRRTTVLTTAETTTKVQVSWEFLNQR